MYIDVVSKRLMSGSEAEAWNLGSFEQQHVINVVSLARVEQ